MASSVRRIAPFAAGAALLALVFWPKKASAAPAPADDEPAAPPVPAGPVVPEGFALGVVSPACGPNDPPKCRNGLRVHAAPLLAPEKADAIASIPTGQTIAVRLGAATTSDGRIWAEVVTAAGVRGFASQRRPGDSRDNFTNVRAALAGTSIPTPAGGVQIGNPDDFVDAPIRIEQLARIGMAPAGWSPGWRGRP